MHPTRIGVEGDEHFLDEVLAQYLHAHHAGHAPSRDKLTAQYPQFAEQFARFFADQDHVERAAACIRQILAPLSLPGAGCALGDYELLEEIAQGGMGVVWKAYQKGLDRIVAVKILRTGRLPVRSEWHRLRIEAQAVAALDHPGIVPIYEVGEEDGVPFFSMKYVEGGNLARQRDRFPAAPREAARLVALAARALQHAHERGILHRDLKPANILLARSPDAPLSDWQPIITDFGLAKRVASPTENDVLPIPHLLTSAGAILGTPVYLAPEQARGEGPTTATDIYGLGIILFELVTGQQPFQGTAIEDLLQRVQSQDPPRPRSLNPSIDRDLEAIVLVCLRKRPRERYASAADLAADLERYLAGKSTSARPGRWPRRLGMWCRRQPTIAALLASLGFLFVVSFAVVFIEWRRAEANYRAQQKERERAEANLDRIEAILDDFGSRLSENDLASIPGLHPVRKRFLEAALRHYQELLAQRASDPRIRARIAAIHRRIGDLTAAIGSRADGLASCRRALEEYAALLHENPNDPELQLLVGRTTHRTGVLEAELGEGDLAEKSFAQALQILQEQYLERSPNSSARSALALVWHDLGNLHLAHGKHRDALACFETERTLHEEARKKGPDSRSTRYALAVAVDSVGDVQGRLGNRPARLQSQQQARALLEELNREQPEARVRSNLALVYLRMGSAFCGEQRWDDALEILGAGRDLLVQLAEEHPHVLPHRDDLAMILRQMGHAHRESGRAQEAAECYREAIRIAEKLSRLDPSSPAYRRSLARGCFDLAGVLGTSRKRNDEAVVYLLRARDCYRVLSTAEPKAVDYHHSLALTLNNIAVLKHQTAPEEAALAAREARTHGQALATLAPSLPEFREVLNTSYKMLADFECRLARFDDSYDATLARQHLYPANPEHLHQCARDLALLAAAFGRAKDQLSTAEQARQEEYLRSAEAILGDAIASGWRDVAKLNKDPAWTPLRQRDAFQALIRSVKQASK